MAKRQVSFFARELENVKNVEEIGITPDLISINPTTGVSGKTQFKLSYTLSNVPVF